MTRKKERLQMQRNLFATLQRNEKNEFISIVLKNKKIDLNFLEINFCSPLMYEAWRRYPSRQWMQYLLDHGAKIDLRNSYAMTAFHFAMKNEDISSEVIWFLLLSGANPNAVSETGNTPLHLGCQHAINVGVLSLLELCNGRDHQNVRDEGMTYRHVPKINVNCINNDGDTPLMLATKSYKPESNVVKILLEYNAKINIVNKQKFGALYFAVKKGSPDVVDMLLCHGADANIVNDEDSTPLDYACSHGRVNEVRSLLAYKANVNRQNQFGRTALHLLADNNQDHFLSRDIIDIQLCYGADINIQDYNGETPLFYAVRRFFELQNYDQRPNMMSLIKTLLYARSDVDIQLLNGVGDLVKGDTILHCAVRNKHWNMVELILSYSPDLRLRNCRRQTARHVARKLDTNKASCMKIINIIE